MNNGAGSAESVSIIGVVEVERDANGNTFSTNLNDETQRIFFEGKVKIEKGTLIEIVTEKDRRIGFGIEFVGSIGT